MSMVEDVPDLSDTLLHRRPHGSENCFRNVSKSEVDSLGGGILISVASALF